MRRIRQLGVGLGALLTLGCAAGFAWDVAGRRPSNDRNWLPEQVLLAEIAFEGDTVDIRNVRNVRYRSTTDYDVRHMDTQYDLGQLESVWFIVEPFAAWDGAAHTFVSFGFADGRYLAVSVELRKEVGEDFSPVRGLFRNYELIYVIADERDVIGLRANHRHDDVYLYPMRADTEAMRAMLQDILESAEDLRHHPRFYNTLTQNCTTTIVDHVNAVIPQTIPFSYKIIAPGYSDELAHELGLIDTELSLDALRPHFRINEAAAAHADAEDFSLRIRAHL